MNNPAFVKGFLFATALFLSFISNAQLSGTAILNGQSNHAGIKVKFTAGSSSAATDSCFTNANGSFSKNLLPGLYLVKYTMPGYVDMMYDYAPVVITNTTVLDSMALDPGTAVYVSGDVSGNWTNNNVYYITGDLHVPAGTVLNIQAGTKIKFLSYRSWNVDGAIKAIGMPARRIVFTSNMPRPNKSEWNGFTLRNNGSVFDFCIIEHCNLGIETKSGVDVAITNSIMRHHNAGAMLASGPLYVSGNEFYDYTDFGIMCSGSALQGTITCNHLHGAEGTSFSSTNNSYPKAILGRGNYIITNNNIHHNGHAINMGQNSGGFIQNNYIHHNSYGITCDETPVSTCTITNNTLLDNYFAMWGGLAARFSNNIVANSFVGMWSNMMCDYNLFFNNTRNFEPGTGMPGVGQVINNNSNGDPVDSYFNVFTDPDFMAGNVPYLQPNSSALGAGNPAYAANIGASAASVCYSNLTVGLNVYGKTNAVFKFYPNPNNGNFTVELNNNSQLTIYDLLGKNILNLNLNSGKHAIDLSAEKSGIYFMTVKEDDNIATMKLVKE